MTTGARPGLLRLHRDFGERVRFVLVFVREAHPGERYPAHRSFERKMRHARDLVALDGYPWPVAVDDLEGSVHRAYLPLPNAVYLVDSTGHVAFRALWAGQEWLLRHRLEALMEREAAGAVPADLGERANLAIPLLHGGAEFEYAVGRAGDKAKADFRRELGGAVYALQKLLVALRPWINPGNRDLPCTVREEVREEGA